MYLFLEKANIIHNNFYDYSMVDYKNSYTKIKIICPIHGVFEQMPSNHISGQGCYKCRIHNSKKSNDEFINESNRIHGNLFDYTLTDYKGSNIKVMIICPIHGIFKQTPSNHISGQGCYKCKGGHRKA